MNSSLKFLQAENSHLREVIRKLQDNIRASEKQQVTTATIKKIIYGAQAGLVDQKPISWPARVPSSPHKNPNLMPMLIMGDVHFGEVVDPRAIEGINKYDSDIAESRLRTMVEKCSSLLHRYIYAKYDGIDLVLVGDNVTGNIHEELQITNDSTIPQAVLRLAPIYKWIISSMTREFKRVRIVSVVGNHGRDRSKPYYKQYVWGNWDWLLLQFVRLMMLDDKRITWQLSDSTETQFSLYGKIFRVIHGDQFKGGAGVQGAWSPLFIGDFRRRKRQQSINKPYDFLVGGHWHQTINQSGIIFTGSVKGYDEFAYGMGFPAEPPQQMLIVWRPDGRMVYEMPVYLD